ncbi:hypothetical protein [Glaciihabitans sp. dw_435]|uniref:hypothetical protein n=1 Tax=Glaciihabitans sp. dw_435 TaxID=2720081 RepID=UPI001BD3F54E|nr:hypothetical protein [Glaciihabitans sp. dw_435]
MSLFDPAQSGGSARGPRLSKHDQLTSRIALGFIVAAVGFVLFLLGMFAVTWNVSSGVADCGTGAPPPPGATPETYYIRAGYLPLGIDCVWMVGDDKVVVERSTDWSASVGTYGALLAAVAGTVVAVRAMGARSRIPRRTRDAAL